MTQEVNSLPEPQELARKLRQDGKAVWGHWTIIGRGLGGASYLVAINESTGSAHLRMFGGPISDEQVAKLIEELQEK